MLNTSYNKTKKLTERLVVLFTLVLITFSAIYFYLGLAKSSKLNLAISEVDAQEVCNTRGPCTGPDGDPCCSGYSCVFGRCQPNTPPAPAGPRPVGGAMVRINNCPNQGSYLNGFYYGGCLNGGCTQAPAICRNDTVYTLSWTRYPATASSTWQPTQSHGLGHIPGFSFPAGQRPADGDTVFRLQLNGIQNIASLNFWSIAETKWLGGVGQTALSNIGFASGNFYSDAALTQPIGGTWQDAQFPATVYFRIQNYKGFPSNVENGTTYYYDNHLWIWDHRWCGDGRVDNPNSDGVAEQCDDGNNTNGDGCSNTCQTERPAALSCISKKAYTSTGVLIPAGSTVSRGQTFKYRIDYRNDGGMNATNASLTDYLPSQLEFTPPAPVPCMPDSQGRIQCGVGSVGVGETQSIDLIVRVKDNAVSGQFQNTASVQPGSTGNLCALSLVIAAPTVTITPPPPTVTITPTITIAPTVTITPTPAVVGKTFQYKFRLWSDSNPMRARIRYGLITSGVVATNYVSNVYAYRWDNVVPPTAGVANYSVRYLLENNNRLYSSNPFNQHFDTSLTRGTRYYYKYCVQQSTPVSRLVCTPANSSPLIAGTVANPLATFTLTVNY